MSETIPKSPAVLQAQLAEFATNGVEHYRDRDYLFKNLGALAVGEMTDVTRVIIDPIEKHIDDNGIRVPIGTERLVATQSSLRRIFLRSIGGMPMKAYKTV